MTAQYFRIFRWHVLRHLRRHPLLAALNILSVALGVAVYLATQIANQSANRAFAATVDMVAGKAELQITAPAGNLPETVLPMAANAPGVSAATPLVRGLVTLPDFPGEYLEIFGIDIFTNEPFRTFDPAGFDAGEFDLQRWLGVAGTIAVTEEFVAKHKLKAGDKLRVRLNVVDHELEVGFILRSEGTFDPHFAAMDIGWAQELFGRRGTLSAIQLRLANPRDREKVISELRQVLPKDAKVAAPAQRTEEIEKMLSGFELNLSAMSLLSLVVGMFLIYNTVSASVVRRRREIGILRSLGVTRHEVRALFLGEAIVLGAFGALLGLAGGLLLAQFLVGAVAETISSLYVLVNVRQLALNPWTFVIAWTGRSPIGRRFCVASRSCRGANGTGSARCMAAVSKEGRFPNRPTKDRALPLLRRNQFEGRFGKRPSLVAVERANLHFWRGRFFLSRPFNRPALAGFCRGFLCPRRIFFSRAVGDHAFQRGRDQILSRHATAWESRGRSGTGRGEPFPCASPKLDHDRRTRRSGGDDCRSERDGVFFPPNGGDVDQPYLDRRPLHRAGFERNHRTFVVLPPGGRAISGRSSSGRSGGYFSRNGVADG